MPLCTCRQAEIGTRTMKTKVNKVSIQTVQGDILSLPVAAFVNDTTTDLALSPRLAQAGGMALQREIAQIGYCEVGNAVITSGGALAAKHIIHAVGPRWGEGSERGKLTSATYECLNLAETHRLKSLALPAISTGTMGYPLENCAKTMIAQAIDFTYEDLRSLRTIVFCLNDTLALRIFDMELRAQVEALNADEGKVMV